MASGPVIVGRLPFPPHARGWTRRDRLDKYRDHQVSPARAGMDLSECVLDHGALRLRFPRTRGDGPFPSSDVAHRCRSGFPRTRGDGPVARHTRDTELMFPPHARGWTPEETRQ